MAGRPKPRKELLRGKPYWVVSLGKSFTGGARQRRYFASRGEASGFIGQSENARERMGREAFVLPLTLRCEAFTCAEKLKPIQASLSQAVEFFLQHHPRGAATKGFGEVCDEFLESRRAMNCRSRTLKQYESYLNVLRDAFKGIGIDTIGLPQIEKWLAAKTWSPRTRKNYAVTLTTIFNFAVSRGYRADNPAGGIERPILDEAAVQILTPAQVRALLTAALASRPEMVPAIAIALFAGLRRSELHALEWEEIDLCSGTIEVTGLKAKTRQRRIVQITATLRAWLTLEHSPSGPVIPTRNIDVCSEQLRLLAETAGISPWPHNALRHSFGSYFLAKTKDENLTASEMGNSPAVVIKHYRAVVKDAEVQAYWGLSPAGRTLDQ